MMRRRRIRRSRAGGTDNDDATIITHRFEHQENQQQKSLLVMRKKEQIQEARQQRRQQDHHRRNNRNHSHSRNLTLYDYPKESVVLLNPKEILLSFIGSSEESKVWSTYRKIGWSTISNDESDDVCMWDGITCDSNSEIISINLSNTDYIGTLPDQLGQLISLEHLDVSHNLFYGSIPKTILELPNLVSLNLSNNKFNGPVILQEEEEEELEQLQPLFQSTSIQKINLSHNQFNGELPSNFFINLLSLTQLEIKNNEFRGTLPSTISKLSLLETLSISNNEFTGILLSEQGSNSFNGLFSLKYAYLDHNRFIGPVPSSFANGHNNKNLDGTSGESSGGSLGRPVLKELWLHSNDLSGTIPATLSELTTLTDLYVDGNKLTGTVPESLCKLKLNNDFFSEIPSFTDDSNNDNNNNSTNTTNSTFTSPIITNTTNNDNNDNNDDEQFDCDRISCPINTIALDGVYPCTECGTSRFGITNPYIGRNGVCASNSNYELNESQIISNFFVSMMKNNNKDEEDITDDNFDSFGDEPLDDDLLLIDKNNIIKSSACDYDGIICNDEGYVTQILLSNKSIQQTTIPDEIGFLRYLEILDLSNNKLTGHVPSGLRFASNLHTLDLSNNLLRGTVPPLLCQQLQSVNSGNGGDDGSSSNIKNNCNNIACPMGTYNTQHGYGKDCIPCPNDKTSFLASKACIPKSLFEEWDSNDGGNYYNNEKPIKPSNNNNQKNENHHMLFIISGMLCFVSISIIIGCLLYTRRRKNGTTTISRNNNKSFITQWISNDYNNDNDEHSDYDDEYSEEDDEDDDYDFEEDDADAEYGISHNNNRRGVSSFPHAEEMKARLKSSSNDIRNYISRGVGYISRKAYHRHDDEDNGSGGDGGRRGRFSDKVVIPGEIDDDGWNYDFDDNNDVNENNNGLFDESKHSDENDDEHDDDDDSDEASELVRIVKKQKDNSSVGVWEYPDPLEVMLDNAGKEIDEEEHDNDNEDHGDDPWKADADSKNEVWLDVPKIS